MRKRKGDGFQNPSFSSLRRAAFSVWKGFNPDLICAHNGLLSVEVRVVSAHGQRCRASSRYRGHALEASPWYDQEFILEGFRTSLPPTPMCRWGK